MRRRRNAVTLEDSCERVQAPKNVFSPTNMAHRTNPPNLAVQWTERRPDFDPKVIKHAMADGFSINSVGNYYSCDIGHAIFSFSKKL